MTFDFRGRPLLSKPLSLSAVTSTKYGGATHVLAVIALDKNGLPINFSGGGGSGDMTKALVVRWPYADVASTWNIIHNMNCYPSVRVEESDTGQQGIPDVDYVSKNEINVFLTRPISGVAYLSRYPNVTLTDEAGTQQPVELIFGDPGNLVVECPLEIPPVTDPTIHQTDYIDPTVP